MSDKNSDWQNAFEQECVKHANSVFCMQKKIDELSEKLQAAEEETGRLKDRIEQMMDSSEIEIEKHLKIARENYLLKEENKILREAVEFYADKKHWLEIVLEGELRDERVREGDFVDALISLESNGYDIARQALEKVRKG